MGYKIVQFYKGPLGPEIKLRFYDYENETILFPPTFPHSHLSLIQDSVTVEAREAEGATVVEEDVKDKRTLVSYVMDITLVISSQL